MAVDASDTRAKLLAAGAKLFATHGIHGAQMRDVVRSAGQANDSAVHYHFGSREGLLAAICRQHIDAMEPDRLGRLAAQGPEPGLQTVIADLVEPTAEQLHSEQGRYFLRITAQLAGHAGVRSGSAPPPIVSQGLRTQLEQLRGACAASMSDDLAGERIAIVIGALTAALADRAATIDDGRPLALDHRAFVTNLRAMLAAALTAPVTATAG